MGVFEEKDKQYLLKIIKLKEMSEKDISKMKEYNDLLYEERYFYEFMSNPSRGEKNKELLSKTNNEELKELLTVNDYNLTQKLTIFAGFVIPKESVERFTQLVTKENLISKSELEKLEIVSKEKQKMRIQETFDKLNEDKKKNTEIIFPLTKNGEVIKIVKDIKNNISIITKSKIREYFYKIGEDNYKELLNELSNQRILSENDYLELLLDFNHERNSLKH